jgi:hypothetical protein
MISITVNVIRVTITMAPKTQLTQQIEQFRKEAEEAKNALNFELAFVLADQADMLEQQLSG